MAYRCVHMILVPRSQSSRSFGSDISHHPSPGNRVESRRHRRKMRTSRIRLCSRANKQVWERSIDGRCLVRRTGRRDGGATNKFLHSSAADRGLDSCEGMDVPWRPDLCAPSRFPYHWLYDIRTLCRHCPQRETTLRHTISSGGDALPTGKGSYLPIRPQCLWLQK